MWSFSTLEGICFEIQIVMFNAINDLLERNRLWSTLSSIPAFGWRKKMENALENVSLETSLRIKILTRDVTNSMQVS